MPAGVLPILIGGAVTLVGSGGLFVALRYHREQAAGYVKMMREILDEERERANRLRTERDECYAKLPH